MASEDIPVQELLFALILDRLKCPRESDLARKERYKLIHVRESREVKVLLLLNHRMFLSHLELKNFLISIFLSTRVNSCNACREFLSLKCFFPFFPTILWIYKHPHCKIII